MQKVICTLMIMFSIVPIQSMNIILEQEFGALKNKLFNTTLPWNDCNLLEAYKHVAVIDRKMKTELDQEAHKNLLEKIRTCKTHLTLMENYYQDRNLNCLLEAEASSYHSSSQTNYNKEKILEAIDILLGKTLVFDPSEQDKLKKIEKWYQQLTQGELSNSELQQIQAKVGILSVNIDYAEPLKRATHKYKNISYKKSAAYIGCASLFLAAGIYSFYKLPVSWYRNVALTASFTSGIGFSCMGITHFLHAYL